MKLRAIDPDWAWSAFEPSQGTPWDLRSAAHLFRRAGFGATWNQLGEAVKRKPAQVVDQLVSADTEPEAFRSEMESLVEASLATDNVKRLSAQWVYRMLTTPTPVLEKMTLFWHGHFATSASKVTDAELMQRQNDLLREYALGDFSRLLLEISRDPAMLLYLDSATNRKAHPNENFAREIMELFCLGEGNYSEQDIRELARCFTGWEIKRKRFRFNRYQHDGGTKKVLGSDVLSGEEGVAVVASQDDAPRFIVRKLIRFFVFDEPQAPSELIEPLAQEMRQNEMQVAPTVRRILASNLFHSPQARGRKVRSPVEFGIGFLRVLEGSTDSFQLADSLEQLGQGLYYPPSVKGWDGGRTWINSSTLLGRANLIRRLIDGGKTRFGKQSIDDYLKSNDIHSSADLIDRLETTLFAVQIPPSARKQIADLDAGSDGNAASRVKDVVHVLCTLPEFQLA